MLLIGTVGTRFIPAGAGNAWPGRYAGGVGAVYPRGCGERPARLLAIASMAGLSPRVRGTLCVEFDTMANKRFIPAGAGNAAIYSGGGIGRPVYPRGCGERLFSLFPLADRFGLSPRVRGTQIDGALASACPRFIPAGAGNAYRPRQTRRPGPVYPRGCGERPSPSTISSGSPGLSPRVRGTRASLFDTDTGNRFIPAGAGNAIY